MSQAPEIDLPFYLRDIHAPVSEEVEAFDLPIEGALPPEIDGLFVRNGPNPSSGDPGHWFLGDGMLHGVELRDGRALSYRNRYVQTRAHAGEARFISDQGVIDFTAGLANTHVVAHAGRILALVENGLPWQVDGELATLGLFDFEGKLQGPMTAHPKLCPVTGEMFFFGYHFAPPFLTYHRVDASGALVESREIEIPRPVMMHDFAITEDFVLFMDLPVVFTPETIGEGGLPYRWNEEAGARLGVMRRGEANAAVRWFEIDPCYAFHPMNAYATGETGSETIVLDLARYDELWRGTSQAFEPARLHRFEIDLARGAVSSRPLDDLSIEFPRVDENLTGLPHRIGYAVTSDTDVGAETNGIARFDLETGAREVWQGGDVFVPSEALFVPESETASEGEGWLLSYVFDRSRGGTDLMVLDATQPAKGPVARVALPQRVPLGFHGSWVPRRG